MAEITTDITKMTDTCDVIKGDMSNANENWVRFVRDHKQHILNNCTTKEVDVYSMLKYRYRPSHFMLDNGYQWQLTWIMLFINDISNESYFTENITSIKLFEVDFIQDLYNIFESSPENK